MIIKTMRGTSVDITSLLASNRNVVAVGNAKMNAGGDILGEGGKIITTMEQVASDYHMNTETQVKRVPVNNLDLDDFLTPAQAVEKYMTPVKPQDTSDDLTPQEALKQAEEKPKRTSTKKAE